MAVPSRSCRYGFLACCCCCWCLLLLLLLLLVMADACLHAVLGKPVADRSVAQPSHSWCVLRIHGPHHTVVAPIIRSHT
jgi:hypothetical protein